MIFKTAIRLSIICSTMLLTGCDSTIADDMGTICKNAPELCNDTHNTGDCRFKRTSVIRARYHDKIDPTEHNKKELLIELDEFESCLELTLFMQSTRNKNRNRLRVENYLSTQALIQDHLKESKGTQDPLLAYYLWSRYQDMQARDIFLNAAMADNVSDSRLLHKLATIHSKDDPQQSLDLFFKALRASHSLDSIPPSSFAMIMTILYQHKRFEDAYIWALIVQEEDDQDEYPINLDLILNKGVAKGKKVIMNEDELEDKAELYHDQLSDGNFLAKAPLLSIAR